MGAKAEKTKEKIRAAAYELFAAKGFKQVTMSDLCEQTGLSRGGLYRYYSGTGEIFSEILTEEYAVRSEDRIRTGERARVILDDMLRVIMQEISDREHSLSLAIYEYASLGNEALFTRITGRAKARWEALIRYGMETDGFQKVNPAQAADLILYYYQGLRMWSRVIPLGEAEAEFYVKTVRQMLLGGAPDYGAYENTI